MTNNQQSAWVPFINTPENFYILGAILLAVAIIVFLIKRKGKKVSPIRILTALIIGYSPIYLYLIAIGYLETNSKIYQDLQTLSCTKNNYSTQKEIKRFLQNDTDIITMAEERYINYKHNECLKANNKPLKEPVINKEIETQQEVWRKRNELLATLYNKK